MVRFFYSLITFIIALFFIMLGVMGLTIQGSENIRSEVINFISEDQLFLSLFSLASILIGISIIFYVTNSFKKRYIKIKSKNNQPFFLDENIFHDSMKNYWKQLFPKHEIPNHVVLKKNKVLITADLPYVPDVQQKALLARIDRELKDIFTRLIGYPHDYVISISFQKEVVSEK